jgi:hypothetical protein
MKKSFKWLMFACPLFLLLACNTEESKYKGLVKQEQAKGINKDSIFQGVKFGMTQKQFYTYCWEMNKKGLFTEGPGSTSVFYKLNTGLKYPASVNFFPDYKSGKIFKMRMEISYDAFSAWNRATFADSLQNDALKLFKKWYGYKNFITLTDPFKGNIYVKVDGNRRITIGQYDESHVKIDYTDLLVEDKFIK